MPMLCWAQFCGGACAATSNAPPCCGVAPQVAAIFLVFSCAPFSLVGLPLGSVATDPAGPDHFTTLGGWNSLPGVLTSCCPNPTGLSHNLLLSFQHHAPGLRWHLSSPPCLVKVPQKNREGEKNGQGTEDGVHRSYANHFPLEREAKCPNFQWGAWLFLPKPCLPAVMWVI